MAHIAERIIKAIEAERLVDDTGTSDDEAYNEAIAAALAATHAAAAEPDPLRELAEWLVALDGSHRRSVDPHRVISEAITRAREALGQSDG